MENCPFCKMTRGDIPVTKIYESKHFYAILDKNPLVEGHALLIPKRHYKTIDEMNEEESRQLGIDMLNLSRKMKQYWPDLSISNSNGEGASQAVPHYHIHFIPRTKGDRLWDGKNSRIVFDVSSDFPRLEPSQEELGKLAKKLKGEAQ
ncbi:HIT domain-containing protein [Candidatus Woesearchaeota archaeon]|nr:HIT domain-containing protein [Candidatus Woesearchaeota archaeon]